MYKVINKRNYVIGLILSDDVDYYQLNLLPYEYIIIEELTPQIKLLAYNNDDLVIEKEDD